MTLVKSFYQTASSHTADTKPLRSLISIAQKYNISINWEWKVRSQIEVNPLY